MTTQYTAAASRDDCINPPERRSGTLRPSFLYMVNVHELKALRGAMAKGALPPDFEAKLTRLEQGDLMHRFVARNCRLFAALLAAIQENSFKEASREECERLLQVLAYVRKDDDAIADYKPGGFRDDLEEVRAVLTELHPLFESFKAWRLRHQVPGMWSNLAPAAIAGPALSTSWPRVLPSNTCRAGNSR